MTGRIASLIALLVSLSACTPCSPFPAPGELQEPRCVDGRWSPLDEVREALGADFVVLVPDHGRALHTNPEWLESGERCTVVSGAEVCVTDREISEEQYSRPLLIAWTDGVPEVHGRAGAAALLAPVESVDEALVLAVLAGFEEPTCGDAFLTGGRRIDEEWELVAIGDVECPLISPNERRDHSMRHWLRVAGDGTIRSLAKEPGRASEWTCFDHCSCFDIAPPSVDVREHD